MFDGQTFTPAIRDGAFAQTLNFTVAGMEEVY
jgi:hypothetical protein